MSELHATRKMYLDSLARYSPAQWNAKPADGGWSPAETAGHILETEDAVYRLIQDALAKPAGTAAPVAATRLDQILRETADPARKLTEVVATAPKPERSPQTAAANFRLRRDRLIAFVEKTPLDLRGRMVPQAEFPDLDCYLWTIWLAGHTARHIPKN